MATRADRLRVVLQLAAEAEDSAADLFHQARLQCEKALEKLNELDLYCDEYQQSLRQTGVQATAETIARARGFLHQLTQAKAQQRQAVTQTQKVMAQKQQCWHAAHLKHRSMKDLVERLQADEQRQMNRKEEKMLDEWVTAGYTRRLQELARD